jgi:hypothetical protein
LTDARVRPIVPETEEAVVSERRRSPRVRAPEGAGGVIRSTIQVHVEDLSRSGARFRLSGAVRPGSTYAFHADLGGFDLSVSIRITRCIATSVPKPGGGMVLGYQAGAEFLWEKPGDEERLAAWLGRRGPNPAQFQADLQG